MSKGSPTETHPIFKQCPGEGRSPAIIKPKLPTMASPPNLNQRERVNQRKTGERPKRLRTKRHYLPPGSLSVQVRRTRKEGMRGRLKTMFTSVSSGPTNAVPGVLKSERSTLPSLLQSKQNTYRCQDEMCYN